MKTRDELAEMFAVGLLRRPRSEQLASGIVSDAFAYADAFVAERGRRARVWPGDATEDTPFDGPRCGVEQCCANPPTHRDRNDRTAWLSGPCCGSPACCTLGGSEGDGWSRAPLDGAPANERPPSNPPKHYADAAFDGAPHYAEPTAEGLLFDENGDMLNRAGIDSADTLADGYAAYRDDVECAVYIRARDRAHAERIVAAMLPVGRGTP